MATTNSRYAPITSQKAPESTNVRTVSEGFGTKNDTMNSTTAGSGTSTTNSTTMGPEALAALNNLIQQLMGGGTQQMAQETATRRGEIRNVQAQRAGFSKEAAMGDAQGLIAQTLRQAMEASIPTLRRAAEGAGTSGNALQALLLQEANTRASQAASAAGVNAAIGYGGVASNMNNTLEALTRPNDVATNALINLLSVAKGSVNKSITNTNETKQTTGSSQSNSATRGSENKVVTANNTFNSKPEPNINYFGPLNADAGKLPSEFLYSALYQLNKDNFTNNLTF